MTRLSKSCFRLAIAALLIVGSGRAEEMLDEPLTAEDREHWAYRPLLRPDLPSPVAASQLQNPIDLFVSRGLDSMELEPAPRASRTVLIRRLYFDLLGLPPSPEAIATFLRDRSPAAYERLVDRILASPRYGERWAQHWLDLARFAETDGFEHDKVRKDAWRYRDWVVAALNADLPYDRFIAFQLAGDELEPTSEAAQVATAFCLSGPDMPDINSQAERRHYLLNEITSTVGAVMLGIQIGCAQCHDHKYDPISQADFYRLRAIFEPAVQVTANRSVGVLQLPSDTSRPVSHLMVRGDFRRPGPVVEPGFPRIANPSSAAPANQADTAAGLRADLADWLTAPDNPLTGRVIANRLWQYHFGEGLSLSPSDFGYLGDEPLYPELLDWLAIELRERGWSLKRLHRELVTSASYQRASLLPDDADAAARVAWDEALKIDPTNLYWSRFRRQRLSGESIRDAMLVVAGSLHLKVGGPGVRPPLPRELVATLLKNQWKVSPEPADHYRRSIYVFARRNLRYPVFEAFDRPDANASCPDRSESTTAPQSLLLLNSDFSLELARRFAGRLMLEYPSRLSDRISLAVELAFGRRATSSEIRQLQDFVETQAIDLRQAGRQPEELALPTFLPAGADQHESAALTDLCLALFNANEFIYVD